MGRKNEKFKRFDWTESGRTWKTANRIRSLYGFIEIGTIINYKTTWATKINYLVRVITGKELVINLSRFIVI